MNIDEVFHPLLGQVVWSIKRGIGTFLTMEFGEPFLRIREPILPAGPRSEKVRNLLARRRVEISGNWHFWVQDADWEFNIDDISVLAGNEGDQRDSDILGQIDGQRLLSVEYSDDAKSLALRFDLGAQLLLKTPEIAGGDLWTLFEHGKNWKTFTADHLLLESNTLFRRSFSSG